MNRPHRIDSDRLGIGGGSDTFSLGSWHQYRMAQHLVRAVMGITQHEAPAIEVVCDRLHVIVAFRRIAYARGYRSNSPVLIRDRGSYEINGTGQLGAFHIMAEQCRSAWHSHRRTQETGAFEGSDFAPARLSEPRAGAPSRLQSTQMPSFRPTQ